MPELFNVVALLLAVTAVFAWLNYQLFRLPTTVGLLLMGLVASLALLGLERAFPNVQLFQELLEGVRDIDLQSAVLNGMLGYLLFAGALNIELSKLHERKWTVGAMATIGVLISTLLIGTVFWLTGWLFGSPIPLVWGLLFGALISPTDPIAVSSMLRRLGVSETLEMDMSGESLFNDGVGIVLFSVLLAVATSPTSSANVGLASVLSLFLLEAGGGGALGILTGWIAYRAMARVDDYPIEVLISLALVTATYALALKLHVSGPIAVVTAGILIGNQGAAEAMSETTRQYLFGFWTLIDQILNLVLFLLIGLDVIVLSGDRTLVPLALAAIPITLAARYIAVSSAVIVLSAKQKFEHGTIRVLTWGGVRGGISVALALSLPDGTFKPTLLAATYSVVLWTIVVQGLTLPWVIQRAGKTGDLRGHAVERRN
jgi:CPA1 family monovalent cation:H+ antiporter